MNSIAHFSQSSLSSLLLRSAIRSLLRGSALPVFLAFAPFESRILMSEHNSVPKLFEKLLDSFVMVVVRQFRFLEHGINEVESSLDHHVWGPIGGRRLRHLHDCGF